MKPLSMPDTDSDRVTRGGSWYDSMRFARVAYRSGGTPSARGSDLGFRLYLEVR